MAKAYKECFHKLALITFLLFWTSHLLLLYALPDLILLVSLMLFAILYSRMDWRNSIMLVVSISVVTLVAVVFLKVTGLNHSIYYRPQEMFSVYDAVRNHYRYEERVNFKMTIPHGDLKAFDERVTSEPRHVLFQTDSYGFRNTKGFHGQKYILVGDSFVAGNGISQQDLITEQLQRFGIDSYNLAHPGRLNDYVKYIRTFRKTYGKHHKFIVFLYEGNDFGSHEVVSVLEHTNVEKAEQYFKVKLDRYRKTWGIENTDIYRFMSTYIQRISYRSIDNDKKVEVHMVRGESIAFYKPYISITKRKNLPVFLHFENILEPIEGNIAHIFFIPTKYRVYYKYLNTHLKMLPNKQWEYIRSMGLKLGIKTTNLTPALIEASDDLLGNNALSFWKGDTHWNEKGISIAAKVVAAVITSNENNQH